MERMPMTCAMGLALECFLKIIPSKWMILRKIFPTTSHSFHVRMTVRKAILNEPKLFGYFCASKVTKRIGVPELLRRFGYFWASKVTKKSFQLKNEYSREIFRETFRLTPMINIE
ncbi:MAG: hypothetical protein KUL85_12600 [Sphingobacterium mizutaii]|nr:hypothetical protein [Sphingobacterium mizutaii]